MGCGASAPAEPALRDPLYGAEAPEAEAQQPPPPVYAKQEGTASLSVAVGSAAADSGDVQPGPESAELPGSSEFVAFGGDFDLAPGPAPDLASGPAEAAGIGLSFGGGGGGGKSTIVHGTAAGLVGDVASSLLPAAPAAALRDVELGSLHAELVAAAAGGIDEPAFGAALRKLLPTTAPPPAESVSALFRAFDTDGSGKVDAAELVAGCRAMCAGDEAAKISLAFSCFDGDGDGSLTRTELTRLLRGTSAGTFNLDGSSPSQPDEHVDGHCLMASRWHARQVPSSPPCGSCTPPSTSLRSTRKRAAQTSQQSLTRLAAPPPSLPPTAK